MFTNQTSFHQLAKKELRMSSPQFCIALLRRLRMPLPLAPHRCTCGGVIDALGDHRAACATTGVLAARAPTLERAVAQICREAGARVACNVAVADMNVDNGVGRWTPHRSRGQWPPSLPWTTAGNRCHLHQPHLPGRSTSPSHTHRPRTGGPTRGATQTPAVPRVNCRAPMQTRRRRS